MAEDSGVSQEAAGISDVVLWGGGQMSHAIQQELAQAPGHRRRFAVSGVVDSEFSQSEAAAALQRADMLIDFSHRKATTRLAGLLNQGYGTNIKGVLVGTTALSEVTIMGLSSWAQEQQVPTVIAANTSVGVFALYHTVKSLMGMLGDKGFDVELIESHHNQKHDAPSGTAKMLLGAVTAHPDHNRSHGAHAADAPRQSGHVGVHAIRGGGIYGHHELQFISQHEVVTVGHSALSRALFAQGALTIAARLTTLPGGIHWLHELPAQFLAPSA